MRVSIAWVLLVMTLGAHAQRQKFIRYNQLRTTASSLAEHGDFIGAGALYDSAFALIPWVAYDHVPAVLNAIHAGADPQANRLLLEAVENGLKVEQYYSPDLLGFLNSERARPFLNDWGYMQMRFLAHADTAAITELHSIGTGKKFVQDENGEVSVLADSSAIDRFVALVQLRGFPTALNVGPVSMNVRRLLADQAPDYPDGHYWRLLLPFINKEIVRGTLEPEFLCLFQDIADHDDGRPLTFGVAMQRYLDEPHILLDARSRIEAARASLGLEPIDKAIRSLETYEAKFRFAEERPVQE